MIGVPILTQEYSVTKPEADITKSRANRWRCLLYALVFPTLFTLIIGLVVVGKRGYVCVELPNGLLIATAPNPRPHKSRGRKIHILKKPDGTVVVPAPSQRLTITETTVYGRAGPTVDSKKLYSFAYRFDTGLLLERKNPAVYNRIVKEAGPQIFLGKERDWVSSYTAYRDGSGNPKYWRTDCPANIFPQS